MTRMALATLPLFLFACGGAGPEPEAPGSGEPVATGMITDEETEPSAGPGASSENAGEPANGEPASTEGEAPGAQEQAPQKTPVNDSKRSMENIIKVIKDNRQKFRLCYDNVQKTKKQLKGDVVINFTINADGQVIDAQVNQEGTTLKDEDVGACAANEMKKLTFPKSDKTAMDSEINYPFNFNPR